jgi:hypothetical protein
MLLNKTVMPEDDFPKDANVRDDLWARLTDDLGLTLKLSTKQATVSS